MYVFVLYLCPDGPIAMRARVCDPYGKRNSDHYVVQTLYHVSFEAVLMGINITPNL